MIQPTCCPVTDGCLSEAASQEQCQTVSHVLNPRLLLFGFVVASICYATSTHVHPFLRSTGAGPSTSAEKHQMKEEAIDIVAYFLETLKDGLNDGIYHGRWCEASASNCTFNDSHARYVSGALILT